MTTTTPRKATITATSRLGVMRSPSMGHASKATKNGAVKLMEAAFASGRYFTPVKKNSIDIRCTMERMTCHFGVVVRTTLMPRDGTNRMTMKMKCDAARAHTICSVL